MQFFKTWLVRKLGGYSSIQDAIDAIQEKELEERKLILSLAVRRLYNTIGSDDILKEQEGNWLFEGKALSDGVKQLIISEAAQLEAMTLWRVLQKDILYQANRKMFLLAKTEIDMIMGKLWLYSFDAIKTRLKSLAQKSATFNKG